MLGGIGGGVGKPKQDPGKRKVSCSNCGTENERVYPTRSEIPKDAGYYLVTVVKEEV